MLNEVLLTSWSQEKWCGPNLGMSTSSALFFSWGSLINAPFLHPQEIKSTHSVLNTQCEQPDLVRIQRLTIEWPLMKAEIPRYWKYSGDCLLGCRRIEPRMAKEATLLRTTSNACSHFNILEDSRSFQKTENKNKKQKNPWLHGIHSEFSYLDSENLKIPCGGIPWAR